MPGLLQNRKICQNTGMPKHKCILCPAYQPGYQAVVLVPYNPKAECSGEAYLSRRACNSPSILSHFKHDACLRSHPPHNALPAGPYEGDATGGAYPPSTLGVILAHLACLKY